MASIYNGKMSKNNRKAVVLAAGRSKRMKSSLSKVVTPILGKAVLLHLLDALQGAGFEPQDIILVVSPEHDDVKRVLDRPVQLAVQDPPLGTAHALLSAMGLLEGFCGDLLVTVGDNPYIQAEDFRGLLREHQAVPAACTLLSAVFPGTPPPYGRVLRDSLGDVSAIVEELDATVEERAIREVNASVYLFDASLVLSRIHRIGNDNKKGEYYLTDIVSILRQDSLRIRALSARDHRVSIGVNTKWELAEATRHLNRLNMKRLAEEQGVLFLQPDSTTVEMDVFIGEDSIVYPCTILAGGVQIGKRCRIGPFVALTGGRVGDDQTVSVSQGINREKS